MDGGMVTTVGRLAVEMGVTTEVVLDACRRAGVSTFGAQSPLDPGEVARVRQLLGPVPWAAPDASTVSRAVGVPIPPAPPTPPAFPAPMPQAPPPIPPGDRKLPMWVVALLGVLTATVVIFGGLLVTGALEDPEPRPFEAVQDVLEETSDEPTVTTPSTPTPGAPGVLDDVLVVGDCWKDPFARSLIDGIDGPADVAWEEMPCDQPHHAEVYAVGQYPNAPGDPFPGDDALFLLGAELCAPHWEPYVGVPLERSVFDSVLLYPTERSWLIGDREVVCSLYPLDGTLLRSSARGVGR